MKMSSMYSFIEESDEEEDEEDEALCHSPLQAHATGELLRDASFTSGITQDTQKTEEAENADNLSSVPITVLTFFKSFIGSGVLFMPSGATSTWLVDAISMLVDAISTQCNTDSRAPATPCAQGSTTRVSSVRSLR